jgi:DNA-binding NarL/FixJ family response regulator
VLAIPGTGNPVHLTENIDAAALRLSPQEISSLAATPRPRTRIPATRRTKGRQSLRQATQALDAGQIRAARERGAAMTPASGVEYTIMMTGEHAQNPAAAPEPGRLSFRERELIALVVQGQTDAQIAGKLSSPSGPSAPTWTGFATRAVAAAAPT